MPAVITELLVGGAWVDISADVRLGHTITRGRSNEASRPSPSRCTLSISNPTGTYSPRNPNSEYFGLIGRNTELRVRVEEYAPTPSLRGTVTTVVGNDDTLAVAPPTGVVAGDVLIAFQSADVSTLGDLSEPTPNGVDTAHPWELLASAYTDWTNDLSTKIWWRVATDYEPPSYTFTHNASADGIVAIAAIKDAGHATPVVSSPTFETNPGTSVVTPTTTPATKNDFELRWVAMTDLTGAANTWTPPAGFTERADLQSTTFTTGSLATRPLTSQAATGTHTFTASSSAFDSAHGFTVNVMADEVRFSGEVSSWPPRWNIAGTDVYTPVEASGILRRLGQGASPLKSALFRVLSTDENLVAYWPMEDELGATQFASGLPGGPPMKFVGNVQPGSSTQPGIGSAPLAVVDSPSSVTAPVPEHTSSEWTVAGLFYFETSPDGIPVLSWTCAGTLPTWDLYHNDALGEITLSARDGTDTEIVNEGFATAAAVAGRWLYWVCSATQNGTGIDYTFGISDGTTTEAQIGSVATQTAGAVRSVLVGGVGDSIGHVYVSDVDLPFAGTGVPAMLGHAGESAVDRLVRLCDEEGIYLEIVGDSVGSEPVGVQRVATLTDLLNDAADADQGILYEPRDRLGLAYRTRGSLYNQTADLALDYGAGQIGPPLEPVDDDQAVRNDVTVRRTDGSEARAVLESGSLSVLAPPAGVGRYDEAVTLNVETDAQLQQIANWRRHLGTWDEARYPSVSVILIAPDVATDSALIAQVARLDLGDVLSIDTPPAWLPPDLIELSAQGVSERLGEIEWDITWNASPAGPFRVFVVEGAGNLGRADTLGCTLAEDLTTAETAIDVTTPVGPVWGTRDLPYDVEVGGEQMTVTAVSGAGSAQTLTVTRAVNGVVKTHATGAAVSLRRPPRWAL